MMQRFGDFGVYDEMIQQDNSITGVCQIVAAFWMVKICCFQVYDGFTSV